MTSRKPDTSKGCVRSHARLNFVTLCLIFVSTQYGTCVPGSVVGIATGYGLDSPGIESRWGRDFPHLSRPARGPTQPPVQWVPGFSRGKERPGRDADPSPSSSAVVMKEQSYTSTPPVGRTACTEPQCL